MGFINLVDAEMLDFRYAESDTLGEFVVSILSDMDKEHEDCCYEFDHEGNTFNIWIGRNLNL